MGVCVDVRIDSDGDAGLDAVVAGHLVDHIDLLKRFAVEGFDAESKCVMYLPVCLSYSCINDLVGRKSA